MFRSCYSASGLLNVAWSRSTIERRDQHSPSRGREANGELLRLGSHGERLGSVGTPTCRTSTRSSRIHSRLVAISICILAFLASPALALADNGNGNAAATSTTSDPAAATTTSSSGDPTTTTSAHNASPAPSAPVTPDASAPTNTSAADTAGAAGQRNGNDNGNAAAPAVTPTPDAAPPVTTAANAQNNGNSDNSPNGNATGQNSSPGNSANAPGQSDPPGQLGSRRKRECVGQRQPGQAEERECRRAESETRVTTAQSCRETAQPPLLVRARRADRDQAPVRLRQLLRPAARLLTQTQPREASPRRLHKQIRLQAKRFQSPTPHRAAQLAASPVQTDSVQPPRHLHQTANRRRIRIRARRLRTSMGSLVTRRPVVTRARVLPETQIPTRRRRV